MQKQIVLSLLTTCSLLLLSTVGFAAPLFNGLDSASNNNKEDAIQILDMKEFNKKRSTKSKCFMEAKTDCDGIDMSGYYSSSNPQEYWKNAGDSFTTKPTHNSTPSTSYAPRNYNNTAQQQTTQAQQQQQTTQAQQQQQANQAAYEPKEHEKQQTQEQNSGNNSSSILLGASNSNSTNNQDANNGYGFVIG